VQQAFNLTKLEVLQLVNHRPTSILEAYLCIQAAIDESRITEDDLDKIVELVAEFLGSA
jgi:hypothetical protein